MDKELEQRIARYKILKAANIPQDQIAREMKVTTRTLRRWSNMEISPELEAEVDAISQQHREKYIEESWAIVHQATAIVAEKLPEASASQAAVIAAIAIDKLRMLEPRVTTTRSETETVTFRFYDESKYPDGPPPLDEPKALPADLDDESLT